MTADGIPEWLERMPGRIAALLVAPHGGRRPERSELEIARPRKVNDLRTAELTRELARLSGAAAIINHGEDRNRLDLNRVSHVRRHAPWLIELLLAAVREQIERRGEATVLFIHGWNAIQPSCDVGIGARLDGERFVAVREGAPSVPSRFVPRLRRFAAGCSADGIHVTFGDRYPAAGRENVLQLLTPRYAGDEDPAIRELAHLGATGRIAAVQLELAVPLRWPGPLRARFLDRMIGLLDDVADGAAEAAATDPPGGEASPQRFALEFHDGGSGIGGFAGIERLPSGRRHARFLVCLGRSELALFTGEDAQPTPGLSCAGIEWTRFDDGRLRVEYRGHCLVFPRSDPFLDLEAGLAAARLAPLHARLDWEALGSGVASGAGRVWGELDVDGARLTVDAPGALDAAFASPAGAVRWNERRVLHVPLGEGTFLSLASRVASEETVSGEIIRGEAREPLLSARVHVSRAGDGITPEAWRLEVVSRSGPLRVFGQVTAAVPVVRPAEHGRMLVFFGLARFQAEGRTGHGTFELARRLDVDAEG